MTIPGLSRLARRSRAQVQRDPLFEDVMRVEDDYFRFSLRARTADHGAMPYGRAVVRLGRSR